jgi:hypothetical protein
MGMKFIPANKLAALAAALDPTAMVDEDESLLTEDERHEREMEREQRELEREIEEEEREMAAMSADIDLDDIKDPVERQASLSPSSSPLVPPYIRRTSY